MSIKNTNRKSSIKRTNAFRGSVHYGLAFDSDEPACHAKQRDGRGG